MPLSKRAYERIKEKAMIGVRTPPYAALAKPGNVPPHAARPKRPRSMSPWSNPLTNRHKPSTLLLRMAVCQNIEGYKKTKKGQKGQK